MSDMSEVLARWLGRERQGQRKAKQQLSYLYPEPRQGGHFWATVRWLPAELGTHVPAVELLQAQQQRL